MISKLKNLTTTVGSGVSSGVSAVSTVVSSKQTVDVKKGEINELKAALSDPIIDRDQNKKREVLQKVIGYMTMGLDTSKLFNNMVMCIHTKDIVQKKMVYQYIIHYAHLHPDSSILTINSVSMDCRDESPLVRGLALRCLSSLRIPKLVEHLLPLIKEGLNDPSPYVRKTAVLSVVKLHKIDPKTAESEKFAERLYSMIRDKDPQVVVNCIKALNEILEDEGGIKVTKKMIYYLLNRVAEYNEWQLCEVLELLLKYTPGDNNEVFDVMNLLDDKLQIANAAVVMAITNVFLQFTQNMPKIHTRVYSRLRDPLLLLLATASHELAYSLLCHIKLMISRVPNVFAPFFRDFYIKHNEPTYLKHLKLETLTLVANEQNVREIMEELSYYVSLGDNEVSTSRKAIRALGDIAVSISSATEVSLNHLLDFLDMGVVHVLSETFIVLKDILRKYNNKDFCETYLPAITKHWRSIDDPKSLCAFIWILGEYGTTIEMAPYILETFIDNFKSHHHSVRIEILVSTVKLFFKRPPEVHAMMGRLFSHAIEDNSHADVHDRALFLYRLLEANIHLAREVVLSQKQIVNNFTEEESAEYKDRLFSEFNTLSIVFGKPSTHFIKKGAGILGEEEEEDEDEDEENQDDEEDYDEEEEEEDEEDEREVNLLSRYDEREQGLLDFGDQQQQQQQQRAKLSGYQRASLSLSNNASINPPQYQQKWQGQSQGKPTTFQLRSRPNSDDFERVLKHANIFCLAANTKAEPYLYYFFAQSAQDETYFMIQARLFANGVVDSTVKHEGGNQEELDAFASLFQNTLKPFM